MSDRGRRRTTSGDRGRPGLVAVRRLTSPAVVVALLTLPTPQERDWTSARPDYAWTFPRDHWSHDGYKTEWWYFTGHLTAEGDTAPRFGYQLTMFRVGLVPAMPPLASSWAAKELVMGHAAITDLAAGDHVFSELVRRATPMLGGFGSHPDPILAWSTAPAGTTGRWEVRWNGSAFDLVARDDAAGIGLALSTEPVKRHALHGHNGYSRKGEGAAAASQYYSYTRLRTTGSVTLHGERFTVAGRTWMDHEFGSNQLGVDQTGWDWFALQLDDGRDVMLYVIRGTAPAADFMHGTLIERDGTTRTLDRGDWTVRSTESWRSRASGARYPARWTVSIPSAGIEVEITPLLADQENVSVLVPGLVYWEGAVVVRDRAGRTVGRGYVELTGYGEGGRLPI